MCAQPCDLRQADRCRLPQRFRPTYIPLSSPDGSGLCTMTSSLPSVPDLGNPRYEQAACDRGNPGPEENVPVAASYLVIDTNERKPDAHKDDAAA